jgi:hypothetical protein
LHALRAGDLNDFPPLEQHGVAQLVGPLPLDLIERAMRAIGVHRSDWLRICSNIQIVIAKSRFRQPSAGQGTSPADIIEAIRQIREGLEKIDSGIFKLDYARKTVGLDAGERNEALEQVQKACLGNVAEAVIRCLPTAQISDEVLADAMPSYTPNGFSNSWNSAFSLSAARVKAIGEAFSASDFRVPTRRQDIVFVTLIGDLADIYTDATGNRATSPNASGNVGMEWRSVFSQFVADLWPCVGVFGDDVQSVTWNASAPSNKQIRDALKKSDELRAETGAK